MGSKILTEPLRVNVNAVVTLKGFLVFGRLCNISWFMQTFQISGTRVIPAETVGALGHLTHTLGKK